VTKETRRSVAAAAVMDSHFILFVMIASVCHNKKNQLLSLSLTRMRNIKEKKRRKVANKCIHTK
jgi:hypothetical protein